MEIEPIRVLIVDDYEVVRVGIAAALNREGDIEVCGTASDGDEAVALFRQHRPHVTIMDLRMPTMDGVAAIEIIREEFPHACILAFTVSDEKAAIFRALNAGAQAYILKSAPRAEIIALVRTLYQKSHSSFRK